MKKYFVQSDVVPDFNYSREHVAAMVPILQAEGIGLGSSNSNKSKGLVLQPPSGAPGVLTYYPRLSGTVILAPEVQGDDYRGTYGHDTPLTIHGTSGFTCGCAMNSKPTTPSCSGTIPIGWGMPPRQAC